MTEETNTSSEKEQEAQETSNSTEEKKSPAESEQMVPVAKHAALRSRAQAAELKAANLEGQLTTLQQTTASSVKSPMEIEIARQTEEGIAEEDMTITPVLYHKQQAFEKQQTEQAAQTTAAQTRSDAQLASRELAILAHEDWQEVVNEAVKHMTKGEQLDLSNEREKFGEAIYAKSQEVLERVKPNTAPESSESEAAKKEAAEKLAAEKTPSQDEILADLRVDPVTEAAAKL